MHPVQAANERGFPATRRPDQCRRVVGLHDDIDVEQRLRPAVKRVQVLDCNSNAHSWFTLLMLLTTFRAYRDPHRRDGAHDKNDQNQRARPCLPVPFIEGRNRISENLQRQRRRRLVRLPIPELVSERRE